MTSYAHVARRTFSAADQGQFAAVSGDRNPMHFDAIFARRTQAGAPIVHGVHLVLWAMDSFAAKFRGISPVAHLKVRFRKFVYVDDEVEALSLKQDKTKCRIDVRSNGISAAKITISFGEPADAPRQSDNHIAVPPPLAPFDHEFEQDKNRSGLLGFAAPPETIGSMFPAAAEWIGAPRVAALAATSNLIGMVNPGLHSIFGGLRLASCMEPALQCSLAFQVTEADPRFRLIEQRVQGGGWVGEVTSFAGVPPVVQPPMKSLAGLVHPSEFGGSVALVAGGSRGLGEVAAKLLASGAGRVIITYRIGKVDAERVMQEICAQGGLCAILPYDARQPAEAQLAGLPARPTHLYYFATPHIFRAGPDAFSQERFREFAGVYIDGFWRLVKALYDPEHDLSVFYPSSVAVDEMPKGMTEYTMAKAAGEVMCAGLNKTLPRLHIVVSRLPRLRTDQTVSLVTSEAAGPVKVMLPLIREVQTVKR